MPIFLVPVIVAPVATDLPDRDVLPKMVLLTASTVLFTMAVAGHTCNTLTTASASASASAAAASASASSGGATPIPSVHRAATLAAKVVSSPRVAAVLAGAGLIATAAATAVSLTDDSAVANYADNAVGKGNSIASRSFEAAPLYAAATAASYFAAPVLTPASIALYFPPTLFAGTSLLVLTAAVGAAKETSSWQREGQEYLAGPARIYLDTLGTYAVHARTGCNAYVYIYIFGCGVLPS